MCLGIPGRIVEMRDDTGLPMGTVDFGGVRREVCLAYVADEVGVGDYVVVHVGFAISKVDEEEARRTFESLREMSQLEELEWMREVAETRPRATRRRSRMRYLSEYRDPERGAGAGRTRSARRPRRRWVLMEVCGGQTHTIVKQGLDELLGRRGRDDPRPGLPGVRDAARADRQGARARGAAGRDLHVVRRHAARAGQRVRPAAGAGARRHVRVVYSPLDALELAQAQPGQRGRVLRGRLRDHGAGQRHGGVAGRASSA